MKLSLQISQGLSHPEIFVLLLAAVFGSEYVEYSARILEWFAPRQIDLLEVAYGIVISFVALVSSVARNLVGKSHTSSSRPNLFFTALIVASIITLIYQYVNNPSGRLLATEVVTPYIGYLFTLFICLGVGYILADFVIHIFRKD